MRLCGVRLIHLEPSSPRANAGPVVDLRISEGRIFEITPSSTWSGQWVIPGLWDHHVHMTEWARTSHRLNLSQAATPTQALASVRAAVEENGPLVAAGQLVGTGLWHARWDNPFGTPGGPTQADLDAVTGDLPTILISADLHSAWFNSAAARMYGINDEGSESFSRRTGLVAEEAWFPRMADIAGSEDDMADSWVAQAAATAAARGIVGVVDYEFHDTHAAWRRRVEQGLSSHRVQAAAWPEHLDAAIAAGLRTGDPLGDDGGLLEMGPLKIISDGSLNTRTAWCHDPYPDRSFGAPNLEESELRDLMAQAHAAGINSAIHAIGDRANSIALSAFTATGARGSIEHAQLLCHDDVGRFRALGVTASVQPAHLLDDRDTAETLWTGRTHRAFPLADLHRAGVELRLGSDAPVAPLDPWLAIQAACTRTADDRPAWHGEQILDRAVALSASVGAPALVEGGPADLVVLDENPLTFPASDLQEIPVAQTICAGRVTFER